MENINKFENDYKRICFVTTEYFKENKYTTNL